MLGLVSIVKVTGRRGPYAGTAQRRNSILKVAWEVFASQGFRGGSLREISARLGLSPAGILHHFGSKEGLLLEVLRYRDNLGKPSEFVGIGILDHLRAVIVSNTQTPGAVQLFVTMSAEATDPDHPAHEYFVGRYTEIVNLYTSVFALARRDGDVRDDLDPEFAARHLIAFLDGIQLQWLLIPSFDMVAAYDQYAQQFRARYQTKASTADS